MQRLNWNDIQDFLYVARAGRLSRASASAGVDATTVGRRMRRLERRLGQILFEQTGEGLVLTTAGEALLIQAEAMQTAADRITDTPDTSHELSGLLRVSVSEGLGTWYVADRLREFAQAHPGLTIDLVASSGFLSPSKRETDIAIMLGRPAASALICSRLTDYELGVYAAHAYLDRLGEPGSVEELASRHTLIGYVPELLYAPQLNYLGEIGAALEPRLRSTSINAQYRAVASGAGLAILPYFIGRADRTLRRVLPDLTITRSFWMVTHRDTRALRRVRVFQAWLAAQVRHDRDVFVQTDGIPVAP